MPKIDLDKVFWRKVDGQTFVCDATNGQSYTLEGTAGFIWEMLLQGKSLEEMNSFLVRTFGVDSKIAQADIKKFLQDMETAGLICKENGT